MKKISSNILFAIFFLLIVFTRSFAGIYIAQYRLGEYLVAIGLIITVILLFVTKEKISINSPVLNIFKLIFIAFLVTNFVTGSDLLWTYTYRVTSFIWTAAYVFIGYILFKDVFSKNKIYLMLFGIFVIYVFGTGNYPDDLINIFREISDKFTFVKASDMVLAIVITNLISLNYLTKKQSYIYFLISVSTFLPLIIQMSRGSAISLIMFALMYILFDYRYIVFN